ncbi:MAG: hypothetical protein ACXW2R_00815 [Candidatus Aminicenantales bacterium]
MRFRYLLTIVLAVGALSAQTVPPAKPAAIGGVWEMTTQGTPQGDMTADVTFVQEGDKIKVTMAGPQGFEMAGEGTVKGQDVEWALVISTPQGDFTLTYKGKVDGETMSGEVQAGDFGAFPWTAKKKK